MMKDTGVAARYARALMIVTEKRGETAQALADLQALWEIAKPGTRVGGLLASPLVLLSDKRKVVMERLQGRCLKSVALLVDLLLRKKRLAELEIIVSEFEAMVEKAHGIQRAHVVSAVPLDDAEVARLHAELERWTGKKIKLAKDVDPDLVGGAQVRIDDRVVDRSVKTLLEAIGHQLHMTSV